ncbi:HNH nuclease [Microbacterium laevaniformans OR221]|nr:HNH nuclease [Microbacterium laevaniformans OR221]
MSKTPRNTTTRDRDRRTIAARHENCGICGRTIDYTLKWPDLMCFVVDHIIPIKLGGLDILSNKQAAHNDCNSKKRARLYAPIIRRSNTLAR